MTRPIEIIRSTDGIAHIKTVSLGCCPFCREEQEMIVSDVEREGHDPNDWPSAVHCGACGSSGPWSKTEEGAVQRWNAATGAEVLSITDWRAILPHAPDLDGFPF